jgi:hypothetical protein
MKDARAPHTATLVHGRARSRPDIVFHRRLVSRRRLGPTSRATSARTRRERDLGASFAI